MYEEALKLLKEINNQGYKAYIIGGYPRDKYRGILNSDIDICTNMKPNIIEKTFKIIKSYKEFGSYKIEYNNFQYEITTFRKDIEYIDNRHPKIEFVETLEEDLKRRDFIMNTLCIDENGNYIDPLNAKKDIEDKIIRCVGDISKKIEEDPLRIIRCLRFEITLNFKIEENLNKYIESHLNLIEKINKNKILQEINKIEDVSNQNLLKQKLKI